LTVTTDTTATRTFARTMHRFIVGARSDPKRAETFVRSRGVDVRERARASRDPNNTLLQQLPAWCDALFQAAIEGIVAESRRGPAERRNAEQRARFVAEQLDEVHAALEFAHLAEDDDERHDEIFAAHKALVRAEAAF
jgi:hypothetical protein